MLAADKSVKIPNHVEALLVRNLAECIVRIDSGVVDEELCKSVVLAIVVDGVLEVFPSDDRREIKVRRAMESGNDSTLQVCRPSLVQPAGRVLVYNHSYSQVKLTNAPSCSLSPNYHSSCAIAHAQSHPRFPDHQRPASCQIPLSPRTVRTAKPH